MGGWGLGAINTCVILLLPQSVNSMWRGGGKGAMIGTESQKLVWYASSIQERHLPLESSSTCTSCTTCTSTTALLLYIHQRHCPPKTCPQCLCLSMPCYSSLLLKSAIFSFEWHLRQGLAAFLDSKICVLQVLHFYPLEMFGQCGFPFARLQYTWTDVSWLAGETTEALVCPHKLRASEPILTIVTTEMYNCTSHISRMMHMFALCFLSPLWVESTHRWQGCITSVTHFDSSTRTLRFWCQVTSPPSLARATTPQFGSVDHIFCLATSPTSKPGLSCICQCSGYKFLTDN